MAEWISVKDRLPKWGEKVLCYVNDSLSTPNQYYICAYLVNGNAWYSAYEGEDDVEHNVTHWQYLYPPKD